MGSRRNETPKQRIMRLVQTAFHLANSGEEDAARSYWKSAVNSGYDPDEKNAKGFELAIKRGKRKALRSSKEAPT